MPTLADLFTTCYLTGGNGVEFSAIRLHCRGVDEICRTFGATALTVGSDIYFRQEAFAPHTPEGLRLLAHEVAHVVQQHRGAVAAPQAAGGLAVAPAGSAEEREADAAADALLSGRRFDFGAAGFPAAPNGPDRCVVQRYMAWEHCVLATWTPRGSARSTWTRSAPCSSSSAGTRVTSTRNGCGPSTQAPRRCACPAAGWW